MSAASVLAVSVRHVHRLLLRLEADSGASPALRSHRRPPNNGIDVAIQDYVIAYVIALVREKYVDFGPTLAAEMLVRHHAVLLGNTCCLPVLLTHFHYLSVFAIEAAKYAEGRFQMAEQTESLLTLAAQIVSSHVAHNAVTGDQLPELIRTVRQALSNAGKAPVVLKKSVPAVDIKKSVVQDYIVCLDCGAKMKMLKRHLAADHDTTPDEYRTKWNLNSNYPMVSPNYSKVRSKLAKALGLGLEKSPRR